MLKVPNLSVCSSAFLLVCLHLQNLAFADTNAIGNELFQQHCSSCHSLSGDGESPLGPALYDFVGKPVAGKSEYDYSQALLDKATAGLIWDAESLDHFLFSPTGTIPGTKMSFSGLTDANDRQTLINWMSEDQSAAVINDSADVADPDVERILAISADPEYGEYLAGECVTCHAGATASGAVPSINGLPTSYFLQAMIEYRNGLRENQVMRLMAGNLGDEELAALAAFFANKQ